MARVSQLSRKESTMARPAYSLDVLLGQLDTLYPNRSKASDGWIGDPAHASRTSDHNPDRYGIVRARDFTHDPDDDMGIDCHWLATMLVKSFDTRIKYIIWNRRIWQWNGWQAYSGTNPHTSHLHLSVKATSIADDRTQWDLEILMAALTAAEQRNLYNRVFGMMPQRWYKMVDGKAVQCSDNDPARRPATVLDSLDGASLAQRHVESQEEIAELKAQVAELRHYVESLQ
jgi:hypothetical protein